jgi:hypothetical protein
MSHLNNAYMSYLHKKGLGESVENTYQTWIEQGNTGSINDFVNKITKSTYQYWLSQGNTGTEQDFLDKLLVKSGFQYWIEQGNTGTLEDYTQFLRGKSAYEIWLAQGNFGSEMDFLESLQADKSAESLFERRHFVANQDQKNFNVGKDFNVDDVIVFLNSALIRDWSKSDTSVHIPTANQSDRIDIFLFGEFIEHFEIKHFDVLSGQTTFDIGNDFNVNTTIVFLNSSLIRTWSKSGNNVVIPSANETDTVDVLLFVNAEEEDGFAIKHFDVASEEIYFNIERNAHEVSVIVFLNASLITQYGKSSESIVIPSAKNGDTVDIIILDAKPILIDANTLNFNNLPRSSDGLEIGKLYIDVDTIKIVI